MDTNQFWNIIDNAFNEARFDEEKKDNLILAKLTECNPEQIVAFERIFREKMREANHWSIVGAQTVIEDGAGDDTFVYFRCWLITLGRENFYKVLKDPDYLSTIDIPVNKKHGYPLVHFESLLSASDRAFSIATNKDEEDESFPRSVISDSELNYDHWYIKIQGHEIMEEDLANAYPKLWHKFHP